jgi:hypothetical protein
LEVLGISDVEGARSGQGRLAAAADQDRRRWLKRWAFDAGAARQEPDAGVEVDATLTHGIDRRRVANPIQARKRRARGEVRLVPCPPPLTALLHAHIQEFGVQPDGRLFVGERNDGELPTMTIGRVWRRARQAAFIPEVAASPLARTPYDLRHAAVSTWLNGGVPPTTVAEWAGHSVEVLLRIYAKCLDGGDAVVRRRVQAALGYADTDEVTVRTCHAHLTRSFRGPSCPSGPRSRRTNGEEHTTEPDASPGYGSPPTRSHRSATNLLLLAACRSQQGIPGCSAVLGTIRVEVERAAKRHPLWRVHGAWTGAVVEGSRSRHGLGLEPAVRHRLGNRVRSAHVRTIHPSQGVRPQ